MRLELKGLVIGVALTLGGLMVAGQTIIDVHPGKVEIASSATDALKVVGDVQLATASANPVGRIGTLTINDAGTVLGGYGGALLMTNISAISGVGDSYGTQATAAQSWAVDIGGRRGGDGGSFSVGDTFTIGRRPSGGSWAPFFRIGSNGKLALPLHLQNVTFAGLGSAPEGSMVFCTNCEAAMGACAADNGSPPLGALAMVITNAWRCFY